MRVENENDIPNSFKECHFQFMENGLLVYLKSDIEGATLYIIFKRLV